MELLSDHIRKKDDLSFEKYYLDYQGDVREDNQKIKVIFQSRNSTYPKFIDTVAENCKVGNDSTPPILIYYQMTNLGNINLPELDDYNDPIEKKISMKGNFYVYFKKQLFDKMNRCIRNGQTVLVLDVGLQDLVSREGHANLLVLDLINGTLLCYEPLKDRGLLDDFNPIYKFTIGKQIKEMLDLEKLSFINMNPQVCPPLQGLQRIEGKCLEPEEEWETGYCHAWSVLYHYMFLTNQEVFQSETEIRYTTSQFNQMYEKYILTLIGLKYLEKDLSISDNELGCLLRELIKIFNVYISDFGERLFVKAYRERDAKTLQRIVPIEGTIIQHQALKAAVENNDSDRVKLLLESGIQPTPTDLATAFELFREIDRYADFRNQNHEKNWEIVDLLIPLVDVNGYGTSSSLIEIAANNSYWRAVDKLLDNGADPAKYIDNNPLYKAIQNRQVDLVTKMLDLGASVDSKILSKALSNISDDNIEVFKKILERDNVVRPYHLFEAHGKWRVYDLLLDQLNNVNVLEWTGMTPLVRVIKDNSSPAPLKIVQKLIEKDQDLNYLNSPSWLESAQVEYRNRTGEDPPEIKIDPLTAAQTNQNRENVIPLIESKLNQSGGDPYYYKYLKYKNKYLQLSMQITS